MQATKITWDDKVGLKRRKIRINQCQDRDLNEIKTAVNNNADLLNQFTFSDPLGSIGIGGTPTAKLSVIGTSPGQDLFDVTDDAGNERFLVDGNGATLVSSTSPTPLGVQQQSSNPTIQRWYNSDGSQSARLLQWGTLDLPGTSSAIEVSTVRLNGRVGSSVFPNICFSNT